MPDYGSTEIGECYNTWRSRQGEHISAIIIRDRRSVYRHQDSSKYRPNIYGSMRYTCSVLLALPGLGFRKEDVLSALQLAFAAFEPIFSSPA